MKKFVVLAVAVFALTVAPVAAQQFGLFSVNPSVSIVMPDNLEMGFGANVSANVGEVMEGLTLLPTVSYWTANYKFSNDYSASNIAVGADVHYTMDAFPKGMYAGGGLNFIIVTFEYPGYNYVTGQIETQSSSDNNLGISAFVGYTFEMGSFDLFAEARYNMINNFNNIQLTVGVPFSMK